MIERWYYVTCDGCGAKAEDANNETDVSIRDCLKFLTKERGWKHENATAITSARDLCPDCNPANKPPPPKPPDPNQQELF